MNNDLPRVIHESEVQRFDRDGVVFIPGVFEKRWVKLLNHGLSRNLASPSDRARVWDRDSEDRTMFWDSQAWQGIPEYQRFIFDSPAASLAGRLMRSSQVNFFFDAIFVRSAGSQFETPWHQDEPYWSVEGYNTCTIWMPLVPVSRENALDFVPGSHRVDSVFNQFNFGDLNPDQKSAVDQVDFQGIAESELPDIDADREKYGVVSWGHGAR